MEHYRVGSPFKVPVDGSIDASLVTAHGPGLEPQNCRANVAQTFKVDATKSGKAPLGVDVRSEKGIRIYSTTYYQRSWEE